MESEVLTNLKAANSKGKAAAPKKAPTKKEATKPETETVEGASGDTVEETGTEATLISAEADRGSGVTESEASDEDVGEEIEQEFVPPSSASALFLPKAKCQACRFLIPTLPVDTVFKGPGLPPKGVKPKEFDCFVEAVCPARNFQMIFDPLTEKRVREVFQEYLDTGDISLLTELYDEAEEIGETSHARLHDLITGLMEEIRTVPVDEPTPPSGPPATAEAEEAPAA